MSFQNIQRTHRFEPAPVQGRIPAELRGTLFRAGPGLFERNGRRIAHPFMADGAIAAVRLEDGRATRATRFVEGSHFREEEQAGRFLFAEGGGFFRRLWHSVRGTVKCTGNTSLFKWQGRMFALMEGGRPVEMSTDTLDTLGERDLGVIPRAFSAHPHYVPSRAATFNFGVRYGRTMQLDLFALPDEGPAQRMSTIDVERRTMIHDFIATDNHLVFYVGPVDLDIKRILLGIGSIDTWFRWRPELGAHFLVVPIDQPERVRKVEAPPFWVWHYANAFEDGDDLVLDLSRHKNLDSLAALGGQGEVAPPKLHRMRIRASNEVESEELSDIPAEFPVVRREEKARRYQSLWGIAQAEPSRTGLGRFDLDGGRADTWVPSEGEEATEPVLDTSERWAMSLVQGREESAVAIFAADAIADGPVATVGLGQRFPITYHGVWHSAA
ncbi:MAG: carotenoid oxygenase family protein [Myxococcota bacterium]